MTFLTRLPNFRAFTAVVLMLLFCLEHWMPRLAQGQENDSRFGSSYMVPASPKEPWSDPTLLTEEDESPWWRDVLLYIPNRVLDLIDVFRVDVGVGASVGGVVRVTKYVQGGYRQMAPVSVRVGDFGRTFPVMVESSSEIGISPAFKQSADREVCDAELGLGLDALVVGGYGGVCLDELADFIGGIFLIDFKDDDFK